MKLSIYFFQQTQKKWEEPGMCAIKQHETFISTHPGEDRDSDSEEEAESSIRQQLPVPIQDEVIEATPATTEEVGEDAEMQQQDEADNEEETSADAESERQEVRDTGEVENDE